MFPVVISNRDIITDFIFAPHYAFLQVGVGLPVPRVSQVGMDVNEAMPLLGCRFGEVRPFGAASGRGGSRDRAKRVLHAVAVRVNGAGFWWNRGRVFLREGPGESGPSC